MYILQVFRHSSILIQRPKLAEASGSILRSELVDPSLEFKDIPMVADDHIVMSEVAPLVSVVQLARCKTLPCVSLSDG